MLGDVDVLADSPTTAFAPLSWHHQVSLFLALGILSFLPGLSAPSHIGPKATTSDLIWNTCGSTSSSGNWLDLTLTAIRELRVFGPKCQR